MNRDQLVGGVGVIGGMELITQVAFHEAGHAAAIYLRNRHYNLPRISFRISVLGIKQPKLQDNRFPPFNNKACHAKLEGGLLLENPILRERDCVSSQANLVYQHACEADVVNLLAGPLAEAKHVAQRDGEYFNRHLVNYDALKNYGGKSDQEKIEEYLDGFRLSPLKKAEKLEALHSAAFHFIDQAHHWRGISLLANYILVSEKESIAYEDAVAILEAAMGEQATDSAVVKTLSAKAWGDNSLNRKNTHCSGKEYGNSGITGGETFSRWCGLDLGKDLLGTPTNAEMKA